MEDFLSKDGLYMFLFAVPTGAEALYFTTECPSPDKIKKKVLLILRARPAKGSPGHEVEITNANIDSEVIYMEINR